MSRHTTSRIIMSRIIKVFASNSIRAVMAELVPQFERASGHSVSVNYDPAKIMKAKGLEPPAIDQ
jgi:ABC-type molybdate transport system substrate-binding protein